MSIYIGVIFIVLEVDIEISDYHEELRLFSTKLFLQGLKTFFLVAINGVNDNERFYNIFFISFYGLICYRKRLRFLVELVTFALTTIET